MVNFKYISIKLPVLAQMVELNSPNIDVFAIATYNHTFRVTFEGANGILFLSRLSDRLF